MKLNPLLRITAPVMAISLLPLAVGLITAWHEHCSHKETSDLVATNVVSMRAAEEVAIGLRDVRTQLERFLISGDRHYLDAVPATRRETDFWLGEAARTAVTAREQELIAHAKEGYRHFFAEVERLTGPDADRPPRAARELLQDGLLNATLEPVQEYLDFNEEQVTSASVENQRTATHTVGGLLLLAVCGPLSGLLAGFGIARGVSRSIVRLSVPVRDAAGKLNEIAGPITLSARWGLEELEGVLHKMAGQIGAVMERLQQSQREALRAEQLAAVGQLAAGMAHELRNPLMAMKILVQAAGEQSQTALLEGRDLEVLEEEIVRLERLVQAFLDFARPPRPEKRRCAVQPLCDQVIDLVSPRAEQQGVRLVRQYPREPVIVLADAGQLRQVVLNLVLNALDVVSTGGTVWVQVSASARRDKRVALCIADTGCGLPDRLGAQIFEPFVSTKETGLGLGLSVCKRLVEAHGGVIRAENRPGGGAVLTVRLPQQPGEAVPPPASRPEPAPLPYA
jgi:signal transduction histidine kinase